MARTEDKRKKTGQDETTTRNTRCKYWTSSRGTTSPKELNNETKEVSYLCMLEYGSKRIFA